MCNEAVAVTGEDRLNGGGDPSACAMTIWPCTGIASGGRPILIATCAPRLRGGL